MLRNLSRVRITSSLRLFLLTLSCRGPRKRFPTFLEGPPYHPYSEVAPLQHRIFARISVTSHLNVPLVFKGGLQKHRNSNLFKSPHLRVPDIAPRVDFNITFWSPLLPGDVDGNLAVTVLMGDLLKIVVGHESPRNSDQTFRSKTRIGGFVCCSWSRGCQKKTNIKETHPGCLNQRLLRIPFSLQRVSQEVTQKTGAF